MKRWMTFVLLVGSISIVANAEAADKIMIRWGDVLAADDPSVKMIYKVAEIVEKRTDGRIEIQPYPDGQLGGVRDMIEAVAMGTQEMVTAHALNFSRWVPNIAIVEAPYIWSGVEHLLNVMDGPIGEDFFNNPLIKESNMRILGTTYYGVRNVTSNKAVRMVEDMKGLKIRVPKDEVFLTMAADAWGANPTPMAFAEFYSALQQGVIDSQESLLPMIDSAKLYEVQKYLIRTDHIITSRLVVINEKFWHALPEEDQEILMEAVKEGIKYNNAEVERREEELRVKFKEQGMTIINPDVKGFYQMAVDAIHPLFDEELWEGIHAARGIGIGDAPTPISTP